MSIRTFAAAFPPPLLIKCCTTCDPTLANVCAAEPFPPTLANVCAAEASVFNAGGEEIRPITDEAFVARRWKASVAVVALAFGGRITCVRLVGAADVMFSNIVGIVSMVTCPCAGATERRFRASSVPTKVLQKRKKKEEEVNQASYMVDLKAFHRKFHSTAVRRTCKDTTNTAVVTVAYTVTVLWQL